MFTDNHLVEVDCQSQGGSSVDEVFSSWCQISYQKQLTVNSISTYQFDYTSLQIMNCNF